MQCPDVNVLVGAFRSDTEHHAVCRKWLDDRVNGVARFALVSNVMIGFLRVVTHPKIFRERSSLDQALEFCDALMSLEHVEVVGPGERHWEVVTQLCRRADARGNLLPDVWFAAVAIENGCEWVTLDRDFARFEGLRWSVPGC